MSRKTLLTYVGADGRALTLTLKDADAVAIDYQAATVTLKLWAMHGGTVKINAATMTKDVVGANEAGEDGQVSYTPTAAEIDTVGDYRCQVEIVTSDGEAEPTYTYEFSEEFVLRVQETIKSLAPAEE